LGTGGEAIGIDHFGASAPGKVLLEKFGLTAENIVRRVKALLGSKANKKTKGTQMNADDRG